MSRSLVLSGETVVVPIIGNPIAQVKSPDGVTRRLASRGYNAVCIPLQANPGDLNALIDGLSVSTSIAGMIATVPHKFGLAERCATLTDRARLLESANVARRNPDGTWHGDHVDGVGFVAAVRSAGGVLEGARALQVGAGGAGTAIALALLEAGVAELRLHDADPARSEALVRRLSKRFGDRVSTGSPDPHRVRPRRQCDTDGDAFRRPLPGGRHAARRRHRRRRRHHEASGPPADRGRAKDRVPNLDGHRDVRGGGRPHGRLPGR